MAVTMNATSEASHVPPRVRLDFDTGDAGTVFASIEVRRDGQLLRDQPPVGSQVSVFYDYDAPFGTSVAYTADIVTVDDGVVDWTETWADLTAWTGATADWSVAGGKASATTIFAPIMRTISGPVGRLEVTDPVEMLFQILDVSNVVIAAVSLHSGIVTVTGNGPSDSVVGAGSWDLVLAEGVASVIGDTWAVSAPYAGTGASVKLTGYSPTDNEVGQIVARVSPTMADVTLSDSVVHDVVEAWLIHPTNPDLSVQLSTFATGDRRDRIYVESASAEKVTYPAQRELFAPLGRSRQVPVTYGRRRVGEWSLVLRCPRKEDRGALRAILDDQAPLLVRVPPSFPWDLDDGWYSVDTVDDERVLGTPTQILRTFTLPLTPCDEPALVQGAQWTYGDDLILNPTYADSLEMFPTYLDRLIGP